MFAAVVQGPLAIPICTLAAFLLGTLGGRVAVRWAVYLTPHQELTPSRAFLGFATGTLMAAFAVALLWLECQQDPMVRPAEVWWYGRLGFHGLLMLLLITATITDFRDYVIPDQITLPGTLLGITLATAAGDLQMMHLWIDWNNEIPGFRPPDFPPWIAEHPHFHGFAWSVTGLLAGAGLTWIVRAASGLILGRQALGFGDVTLMALIGSFLGWQPTVCVFLLAPICGMVLALMTWLFTGRHFVPYGPYLAAATGLVLFTWRWLWEALKYTFGDWQSLAILGTAAITALVVLLTILRLYWSVPIRSRTAAEPSAKNPPSDQSASQPSDPE